MIFKVFSSVTILLTFLFSFSMNSFWATKIKPYVYEEKKADLVINLDKSEEPKTIQNTVKNILEEKPAVHQKAAVYTTEIRNQPSIIQTATSFAPNLLSSLSLIQTRPVFLGPTSTVMVENAISNVDVQTPILPSNSAQALTQTSVSETQNLPSNATNTTNTPVLEPEQGAVLPTPFALGITISEIMYDLEGSDTLGSKSREWVEIINQSSQAITLIGGNKEGSWRFNDGSNHLLALAQGSMVIEPGGFAILAGDASTFLQDHPGFQGTVIDTVMSLNNSSDIISLIDGSGRKVDEVTYSASLGAGGNGKSLGKVGNSWQESGQIGGTPGTSNS